MGFNIKTIFDLRNESKSNNIKNDKEKKKEDRKSVK